MLLHYLIFLIKKKMYLGCAVSSLLLRPFYSGKEPGLRPSCVWASPCHGFSCCRPQALGGQASVAAARVLSRCGSQALEQRLNGCGTQD